MANFKQLLNDVKYFVFDIDGVLSSTLISTNPDGDQSRTLNAKDGYAIQHAIKNGYRICIISGAKSDSIKKRIESLGVQDVYMETHDKYERIKKYIYENQIPKEFILYMGDDIPDYNAMKEVGVPTCPADAVEEIKEISAYISDFKGGEGCVRDVISQVLKLHGKWMNDSAFNW